MNWEATPLGASFTALAAASPRLPVIAGRPPADPDGTWVSLAEYGSADGLALDQSVAAISKFYGVGHRVAVAYFSRWWASRVAHVIVFPLVRDQRVFLPVADELWLRLCEWVDGVAMGHPRALVLAGDPAATSPEAELVGDETMLHRRAVERLLELGAPMIETLCRQATIAERQHWAAVADGIGEACILAGEATGNRDHAWQISEQLIDLASPPLRLRPRRYVLDHDGIVEAAVVKAQCDLAYMNGCLPRHYCLPCPIVKDDERRLRLIDEREHPH